jgi:hypothetical protein
MWLPPENNSCANCFIIAQINQPNRNLTAEWGTAPPYPKGYARHSFSQKYLDDWKTCRNFAAEYSRKYVFIMARPIKETPILYGEDARRFEARMKERRRISPEERARINADYELVLGMLKRGEELKQQRHAATV